MNYFNTLAEALASEGLTLLVHGGINYGDTFATTIDDGTKYGHYVSIYRDERGLYERPVHYARG